MIKILLYIALIAVVLSIISQILIFTLYKRNRPLQKTLKYTNQFDMFLWPIVIVLLIVVILLQR